jgi:hypothetical protein
VASGLLRNLVVNVTANAQPLQRELQGASSIIGKFTSSFGSLTGITSLIGGVTASVATFYKAMEASEVQAKAVTNLNSVLASTGEAAGFSSQELQKMASGLQSVTLFGDEATIQAQAVLATFTQIKGDVFVDAIKRAQDLSTVLGQDLQSSIVQIGKSLNDPINGITALSRVGVSFSDEQKALITGFVEVNDIAGAQKVILAELAKEFGGAAAAQAQNLHGRLTQLKNAFGDLLEGGIDLVAPVLMGWVQAGLRVVSVTQSMIDSVKEFSSSVLGINLSVHENTAAHKGAAAAIRAQVEATNELSGEQKKLTESQDHFLQKLKDEVATFGMSIGQVELYNAKAKGFSDATLQAAEALIKEKSALEASAKASEEFARQQDELASKAQAIRDSLVSPAEEFKNQISEMKALVDAGVLSWTDYRKAVTNAIAEQVRSSNVSAPQTLSGAERGSAAAFQRIAEARGVERMQKIQEQQLQTQREIVNAIEAQGGVGSVAVNVVNF